MNSSALIYVLMLAAVAQATDTSKLTCYQTFTYVCCQYCWGKSPLLCGLIYVGISLAVLVTAGSVWFLASRIYRLCGARRQASSETALDLSAPMSMESLHSNDDLKPKTMV
ncbi:hypothetical protein C8J56DRAFT_1117763 [Mycena floridula]|nr:hypothetical protein C8J56DRAFT_1117763 [Mycena floridula]